MRRTRHRVLAVQGASFAVRGGQFVTMVGPSGCGKTTLLNAIAGLLRVNNGQIVLDGREITGPGHDRAMIFQSASLLPWRTVMRNVTYALELHGCPRNEAGALAQRYIDLVGFRKAMVEAIALMKRDKAGTMSVMAEHLLLDVEDDAPPLTEAYDVLIMGYLPQARCPTLEGIQTLLTNRAEDDPNAANFTPEDVADISIVQELEDSGFIADQYK